jgi:4-amino-4-deoxy-L-arabinose transferase-like glycosyltransferase
MRHASIEGPTLNLYNNQADETMTTRDIATEDAGIARQRGGLGAQWLRDGLGVPALQVSAALTLTLGLGLRLFFILRFPFVAGDTKFYVELARNWLDHGVYGLFIAGQLIPSDMRMPGYPAFLAAIYAVFGRTGMAVMVVQAVVDLATCVLVALMAARLAPASKRAAAATAGLWIAALCPFTANYTAALLTEVLATFLTTLALVIFVFVLGDASMERPLQSLERRELLKWAGWFLLGGLVVGVGTLVRPETPLVLAAFALILSVRWRRRADWPKLALAGLWMAVGLLAALTPWAVRNARTMGRVEFLAPRYAESGGDFIPRGFFAWTGTWMVRLRDAYLVPWKLRKGAIRVETLPQSAFDSDEERARVAELLERYNRDLQMTPVLDHEFAKLAQERTARRPLRTYLFIPIERMGAMWFTPRVELLPYSGNLWPPGEKWRGNRMDFGVTAGFGLLGLLYAGLALGGAWRSRAEPGVALLLMFLAIRTVCLTQLQTVEPRYVLVCFPAILVLGALALGKREGVAHCPPLRNPVRWKRPQEAPAGVIHRE